jgi:hypothetical protein
MIWVADWPACDDLGGRPCAAMIWVADWPACDDFRCLVNQKLNHISEKPTLTDCCKSVHSVWPTGARAAVPSPPQRLCHGHGQRLGRVVGSRNIDRGSVTGGHPRAQWVRACVHPRSTLRARVTPWFAHSFWVPMHTLNTCASPQDGSTPLLAHQNHHTCMLRCVNGDGGKWCVDGVRGECRAN